jgi:hypothetical protein
MYQPHFPSLPELVGNVKVAGLLGKLLVNGLTRGIYGWPHLANDKRHPLANCVHQLTNAGFAALLSCACFCDSDHIQIQPGRVADGEAGGIVRIEKVAAIDGGQILASADGSQVLAAPLPGHAVAEDKEAKDFEVYRPKNRTVEYLQMLMRGAGMPPGRPKAGGRPLGA